MMECKEFREHLEEYTAGAAGVPLEEKMKEHAAGCGECHVLLSSWLLLEEGIAAEKSRKPNPFAATRILQHIEEHVARRPWWEGAFFRPVFTTMLLIAALALGFLLGSQGPGERAAGEGGTGEVQELREQLFISDFLHEDLNDLSNQ